jgi:kojibiose phosphorylase
VHSIVASRVGYVEKATSYFFEASTIDLYEASKKVISGGSFLGGIHTAACGGLWQMIVYGFAGFKIDAKELVFRPVLPKAWDSISFRLLLRGDWFSVKFTHTEFEIRAHDENTEPAAILVGSQSKDLLPGEKALFQLL